MRTNEMEEKGWSCSCHYRRTEKVSHVLV